MNQNEIVLFTDGDKNIEVQISPEKETVWLSSNQMAQLFDRDEKTIRKHVNNVIGDGEIEEDNNTQFLRVDGVKQPVKFYSLDVILSVGYRVNSKRGIAFRRWANSVLKQYIIKGYAINEKRLEALEKLKEFLRRFIRMSMDRMFIRLWKKKLQICCIS